MRWSVAKLTSVFVIVNRRSNITAREITHNDYHTSHREDNKRVRRQVYESNNSITGDNLIGAYLCFQVGFLFSAKADMPSF